MTETTVWTIVTLRRQGMPLPEIRAVLAAGDPAIVRRHLELHRERLEERLAEQRRALAAVESSLTQTIAVGGPGVRSRRPYPRTARCLHP
jgi:DNA-binding transcriptional MerR regulator